MWSTTTAPRAFTVRPDRPALRDAALAAVVLVGTLAVLSHGGLRPRVGGDWSPPGAGDLDVLGMLLAAGAAVPLAAWRRFPLGVFALTAAASALSVGLGYPVDFALGPAAGLYLLAASRPRDTPWTPAASATVLGLFAFYLAAAAIAQEALPGPELLHSGLAWAVAWFAGERTRLRRLHIAHLYERAQRAEHEAERDRRLAAAEERARIARDLHDTAGHAISVIALRAGAARLRHRDDPDRSLATLGAIEELARKTADEIDQLVGSLRDDVRPDGAADAPPGLASLDTLVAHHAAAGLEVTVSRSGAPRRLAGATDRAAYRILQEALTNAARHGTGTARVEVTFGDAEVALAVTNPLPTADAPPRPGGGHGLVGMHERATQLGGNVHTERANGTFRIHARLPDRHPRCDQP